MSNQSVAWKDNRIITASYKLTLNEQRLVLVAIAKIPFGGKVPSDIEITAREMLNLFPDMGKGNVYKYMQEAVEELGNRWIVIVDNPIKTKKFRWIDAKSIYHKGEARVGFSFSRHIIPYLQQLHDQFTKYRLEDISDLKSIYSIRLYEMFMQFQNTVLIVISIEKFRERMGVEDKYPVFSDLRKWVIATAIKELNKKSLLSISFNAKRQGRFIKNLEFFFSEK